MTNPIYISQKIIVITNLFPKNHVAKLRRLPCLVLATGRKKDKITVLTYKVG